MRTRDPDDPLRGPIQESSTRAHALRDTMASVSVDHDIEPLRGDLAGTVSGVTLGEVRIAFVKYGAPTRVIAADTQDAVCWTLPLGPMQVRIGNEPARVVRQGFVLGRDSRTEMLPDPARGAVVITAPAEQLGRHFHATTGAELAENAFIGSSSPGHEHALMDAAWQYVAHLMEASPNPLPGTIASAEQTLLTAMITDLPEQPWDTGFPESRHSPSLAHATRAVAWLDENLTNPVTISSWARGVGISPRHLQQVVREVRGVTPTQLLLDFRLRRAHDLLRSSGPDRTVGSIAAQVGFTHPGRFAAAYRSKYGAAPSDTLHS